MDAEWFRKRQRQLGVTSFDIGERLGRDRTIVSRILNGRQKMSLEQARVFADMLDTPIDEILVRSGTVEPPGARAIRTGFEEALNPLVYKDVAPAGEKDLKTNNVTVAEALGALRPGVDVWAVRGRSMSLQGYLPGDQILVDCLAGEQAKSGDVVIAEAYDHLSGTARTVLRRYEPPALVAASPDTEDNRVFMVDGHNVVIQGRVIACWRS